MKQLLKYFLFLFWLGSMLICSMFLFTRGFLLNREVLQFHSSCKSHSSLGFCDIMFNTTSTNLINGEHILECTEENVVSKKLNSKLDSSQYCFNNNIKVIVLLIDALKYDFVSYNDSLLENETPPFKNKFTVINELLINAPGNGRLFKFIADPPTTTMQRLNGLTTGSLPTFIDVGSNFDTSEINEDNLIDQLVKAKKRITFMGDETLTFMYPGRFKREFPYPSFNVWDLDTVDTNVRAKLLPEMKSNDWDILFAHFLGVDHCGHRYGPNHSEMKRKLLEMNDIVRDVVSEMDNSTVLFVIGDHGMTDTGDHGGDSEEEVTSAMFVYSPRPLMESVNPMQEVRQVDLVPTLASILGVPIPFSNVGSVLIDALPSFSSKPDLSSNWEFIITSLWTNIKQITLYIQEYAKTKEQFPAEKLTEITNDFQKLRLQVGSVGNEEEFLAFIKDGNDFMHGVRAMCEQVWAQFDSFAMSRGLVLHFLLLSLTFIIIEGIPIQQLDSAVDNVFVYFAYGGVLICAIVLGLLKFFEILIDIEQMFYFSAGLVSIVFLAVIVILNWDTISDHWYQMSKTSNTVNVICRLITFFSVLSLFSNSFIINESYTSSFLLISLVFVSVFEAKICELSKKTNKTFDLTVSVKSFIFSIRGKVLLFILILFLTIRFSLVFVICRPEQNCAIERPMLSDSTRCLITIVLIAVFITAIRLYLRTSGNLVGFSPTVFMSRYAPTAIVVATGGFWVLQSLPNKTQHKLFEPWQLQILPHFALCLLLLAFTTLVLRPLSVYHLSHRNDTLIPYDNVIPALFNQLKEVLVRRSGGGSDVKGYPVVYGLATAYSAAFLNFSVMLTLLVALLLASEQAFSAVLLTVSVWLLAIVLTASCNAKGTIPWSCVVCWGLSCLHFFYATGHQASFSAIDWRVAFLLSSGTSLSSYIGPAILVLTNVFCSHVLHAALLPLLIIMPHTLGNHLPKLVSLSPQDAKRAELTLFERDEHMYRAMFRLTVQYMLFFGQRVFGCMLAASIHARHLMVWSIFAPKLIFEGVGFMITLPCAIVGIVLLQRVTRRLDCLLQDIQR